MVKFVNRDNNTDISGWLPVTHLVTEGDVSTGIVSYNYLVDLNNDDARQITLGIVVGNGGYYFRDNASDNTVLTIYKPLNELITGGGFIEAVQSAGKYVSAPGTFTGKVLHNE